MTTLRDSPGHFCPIFVIFGPVFAKNGQKGVQKWSKIDQKWVIFGRPRFWRVFN